MNGSHKKVAEKISEMMKTNYFGGRVLEEYHTDALAVGSIAVPFALDALLGHAAPLYLFVILLA